MTLTYQIVSTKFLIKFQRSFLDAPATQNPNISKVMLNVNSDNDVEPTAETKDILVRTTTKSPPPPTIQKSLETTVGSPTTEVKLVANEDDRISQETETDRSTNKTDSSDEDETKVYNIQMGKSLVVEVPRKLIVENDEVFENIKNENKEVIENTQQTVKVNGTENESISLVNKHLENLQETNPSPRSESPLWSYTLPAPSIFADDKNSSEVRDVRSEQNDASIGSDVASDVSDVPIKTVIQQRIPVDFKALDDTSNTESSMTSDIEDGYRGDEARFSRGALLQSLENRGDEFIENEFEFLTKLESDEKKAMTKMDVPMTNGSNNKDADRIPSQRHDVINELNSVIVNNKLETVIRKSETCDDIEAAQKSCLSNFTIQTYTNHVDVKTESAPDEEKLSQPSEQSVEVVGDTNKRILSDENTTNKSDDEIILRNQSEYTQSKRPSLSNGNHFKSPRVSRSDSFHSTRNGSTEDIGLTSRSSSYISLIGNRSHKTTPRNSLTNGSFSDSNRRKSSSELSIADSPSLQSLLVMKTILSNSRKNSLIVDHLTNGSKENGEVDGENVSRKSSVEMRAISPVAAIDDDSSKENSPQNKLSSKNGETENKWKYQGPPAINLSTWGERPKSMIAIKTDNDYKFGGINAAVDRAVSAESTQSVAETEVLTNTMKPAAAKAANVIVETQIESVDVPDHHLPIVRAVVKKVQPVDSVASDESQNIEVRRPSYEVSTIVNEKTKPETRAPLQSRFSWKIPATFNNASSVINTNLNRNVPTVRGFKADTPDAVSEKDQSIDSGYKSLPPTVVLINANKDVVQERPKTQPPPTVAKRPSFVRQQKSEETNAVPFSQFTLRKTGLKEKIVGADVDNNEPLKQPVIVSPPIQTIQLRQKQEVQNIRPVTVHTTTTAKPHAQDESFKQHVTVSPSVQPVQHTPKQEVQNVRPVTGPATTINISHEPIKQPVTITLRPKKQEVQNIRPITVHTSTIPPPPPPIVKQVPIVRGIITQKSLPITVDPHDALLESIKNFNKNNLKKK